MNAAIQPFQAISISRLAHRLRTEGRSIIHMEFGQPSTGAPRLAVEAAHRHLDAPDMGYWESPQLRERIALHYQEEHGVAVRSDRIILTCGASPALILALTTAFAPGDAVAMARPGYVSYRNALRILHMEPVELACGAAERFQLSAAALAELDPAPRGVILSSPANPTGTVIGDADFAAIADGCAARGIRIISDEIYHGLSFGRPTRTALAHAPDALIVNSFSKYWSMPGWRLGWLVCPDDLLGSARTRVGNLFLTPPSLSQHAALAAFGAREELEGHRATYARNRQLMVAALPRLGLGPIAPPDGAFYIYASVAALTDDSLDLCHRMLLETGVAAAPGIDFDPIDGQHFIRFSFALSTPEVAEAIERLARWLPHQRPDQAKRPPTQPIANA